MVGGRWVRDQIAHIVRLSDEVYKISWDEATGTTVSVAFNIAQRRLHGVTVFLRWVAKDPAKTVWFQNERINDMIGYRDAGPTYPKLAIDEFAAITFMEDCGPDDETVIACAPSDLPEGFAARRN